MKLDPAKLAALEERLSALPPRHVGPPRREPSPEEAKKLREHWGCHTVARLAEGFGVSENTLRRWAREAGLLTASHTSAAAPAPRR